jgi:plastocyanin
MQVWMKIANTLLSMLMCAGLSQAATLSGVVKAGASGSSIVYLEPATATGHADTTTGRQYTISQQHMKFTPRILAVPVGATIVFKNEDSPAHNVFWPSIGGDKKLAHSLGTFTGGQQRSYTFDRAGIVPLLCNVHPEMEGFIIVSPTPYYAQADELIGLYQITDVPDGQYKVTAWHAGKKPETRVVSLSGTTKLDFDLSH